ncbi:glycerol-3-phosphate 1-O-acyltransferase PlsY [Janthinobacterium sp. RB2R34]|uniref:glycerol-3-phosphate 1-O-acyltransferase PlsY n=1 Tax=Janthinobacterium sp. RB2R34 TaxID=3424193 RepID=UPI003F226B5E
MNPVITTLAMTVAAYLLGSISFAVVMSKVYGIADPRTYGSKNPGATNVLRSGNKGAAIMTLLGDGAKGWLAVFLADRFAADLGVGDTAVALVAIAVFLGHLWPVFFRFIGGKGVATALGVLLGINPWLGLATLATWLIIAFAFRYSSLAALVAALFAPFYYGLLFGVDAILLSVVIMSVLLAYRHSQNIANLLAGKESRIGAKKDAAKAAGSKKK